MLPNPVGAGKQYDVGSIYYVDFTVSLHVSTITITTVFLPTLSFITINYNNTRWKRPVSSHSSALTSCSAGLTTSSVLYVR